jgi:hypothetical protein
MQGVKARPKETKEDRFDLRSLLASSGRRRGKSLCFFRAHPVPAGFTQRNKREPVLSRAEGLRSPVGLAVRVSGY